MHDKTKADVKAEAWSVVPFVAVSVLVASACACAGAVFLLGLEYVTRQFELAPWLIFFAPLVGALTAWSDLTFGKSATGGNKILFHVLRASSGGESERAHLKAVPRRMAGLIVIFTWLSHLVGLSVGREGTAIQMGGALAATFGRKLGFGYGVQGRELLRIGLASGFAAVFGVPIAASIFVFEVARSTALEKSILKPPNWRKVLAWVFVLFMAILSDRIAVLVGAHHSLFPHFSLSAVLNVSSACAFLSLVVLAAIAAWAFLVTLDFFKSIWARLFIHSFPRLVMGGLVYSGTYFLPQFARYRGLGLPVIAESFTVSAPLWDWPLKLLVTVFSIGVGFRGGEVTPLMFMGATLGSSLSGWFGLSPQSFAALGFTAVFGAATGAPLACAVMAAELFGVEILLPALILNFTSSYLVRRQKLFD